ncbi:hypothetical protein HYALB_00008431 [Hymenoscyphus albidus]|uniref:Uncharacterized protein n=1 Tax=Hymenoscyphus albidus TaxID=595503 RepID=A0A9N9LN51_9HELO|nr:hypothetical protein HYALB_00008431 [Hymenoscyphus albidus]
MHFQLSHILSLTPLLSPILAAPVSDALDKRQTITKPPPACIPKYVVPPDEKAAICRSLNLQLWEDRMKALWYCC